MGSQERINQSEDSIYAQLCHCGNVSSQINIDIQLS